MGQIRSKAACDSASFQKWDPTAARDSQHYSQSAFRDVTLRAVHWPLCGSYTTKIGNCYKWFTIAQLFVLNPNGRLLLMIFFYSM